MGVVFLYFHTTIVHLEPNGGIDLLYLFIFWGGVAIGIHNALDTEGLQVGIVVEVAAVSNK